MKELAVTIVPTGDAALGSGVACHWSLAHETNSSSRPDGEADQRRKPGAAGKWIGPGTERRPYVGIAPQVPPSAAADDRPPRTATSRPNYHCLVVVWPVRSNSDAQAVVPAPLVFVVDTAVHPGVRRERGPRVERLGRGPSLSDPRRRRGGEHADRVAVGGVGIEAYDIAVIVDSVKDRGAYPFRIGILRQRFRCYVINDSDRKALGTECLANQLRSIGVHSQYLSISEAGKPDWGEGSALVQEAGVQTRSVHEEPSDVTGVVNRGGRQRSGSMSWIDDIGELAGVKIIGVSMTVAVGVVVKAGRDSLIIYAEKLIDGGRRIRRRIRIEDGTVSSGSSIPESIICVRPVVGRGIETDRCSKVVDADDLGLRRSRKILYSDAGRTSNNTGHRRRIALVGMARNAASVVRCNYARVVDPQFLIEGWIGGIDRVEEIVSRCHICSSCLLPPSRGVLGSTGRRSSIVVPLLNQ